MSGGKRSSPTASHKHPSHMMLLWTVPPTCTAAAPSSSALLASLLVTAASTCPSLPPLPSPSLPVAVPSIHATSVMPVVAQRDDMTYSHVDSSRANITNSMLHNYGGLSFLYFDHIVENNHDKNDGSAAHMAFNYIKSETVMDDNDSTNDGTANGKTENLPESLDNQVQIEIPKGSQMEEILNNFFYNDSIPSNSLQPRAHAR